jgi:predicted kinase
MASVLRVDQLQTTNGTPLLSSDGSGVLSVKVDLDYHSIVQQIFPQTLKQGKLYLIRMNL